MTHMPVFRQALASGRVSPPPETSGHFSPILMRNHISFFTSHDASSSHGTGRGGDSLSRVPSFGEYAALAGPPDLPNPMEYDIHHDPMDLGAAPEPGYHAPPPPVPIQIPIPSGPFLDTRALTEGPCTHPHSRTKMCVQRERFERSSPIQSEC
jgi:hypothetical protein